MITEADMCIDRVRDNIQKIVEDLGKVVITECHGSLDYTAEFRETLADLLHIATKLRNTLREA